MGHDDAVANRKYNPDPWNHVEPSLKPCPFCGWNRVVISCKRRGNYRREGDNYQVLCQRCKARGPLIQESQDRAAAGWNDRVPA